MNINKGSADFSTTAPLMKPFLNEPYLGEK